VRRAGTGGFGRQRGDARPKRWADREPEWRKLIAPHYVPAPALRRRCRWMQARRCESDAHVKTIWTLPERVNRLLRFHFRQCGGRRRLREPQSTWASGARRCSMEQFARLDYGFSDRKPAGRSPKSVAARSTARRPGDCAPIALLPQASGFMQRESFGFCVTYRCQFRLGNRTRVGGCKLCQSDDSLRGRRLPRDLDSLQAPAWRACRA
jgi:hypothetical protein